MDVAIKLLESKNISKGSIYLRNGWYWINYYDGGVRKREPTGSKSKEYAIQLLISRRNQVEEYEVQQKFVDDIFLVAKYLTKTIWRCARAVKIKEVKGEYQIICQSKKTNNRTWKTKYVAMKKYRESVVSLMECELRRLAKEIVIMECDRKLERQAMQWFKQKKIDPIDQTLEIKKQEILLRQTLKYFKQFIKEKENEHTDHRDVQGEQFQDETNHEGRV